MAGCALMSVFGTACSVADWVAENFPTPIDEYDWQFYSSGYAYAKPNPIGARHVDELVEQRGPPYMIFEARHRYGDYRNGVPAVAYVYRPSPGKVCLDTYVVIIDSGVIARYHCR
jgi:hypothetical protein